jgi:hypothetical protein
VRVDSTDNNEYAWFAVSRGEDYIQELREIVEQAMTINPQTGEYGILVPVSSADTFETVSTYNITDFEQCFLQAKQAFISDVIPWIQNRLVSYGSSEEINTTVNSFLSLIEAAENN